MKAVKDNKVYTITEEQKNYYLKEGYDIIDDKGKVIEYSPKKVITYNEHLKSIEKIKKELNVEELTKANTELTKKVEELKKVNTELEKTNAELAKSNEKLKKATSK